MDARGQEPRQRSQRRRRRIPVARALAVRLVRDRARAIPMTPHDPPPERIRMDSNARRLALPLAVAAIVAGCSTADNPLVPGVDSPQSAYIVTTDFATGGLSVVDLANRQVTPNVASVHSDATLRVYSGLIYVINRFGQDNIQVIDPGNHFDTVKHCST